MTVEELIDQLQNLIKINKGDSAKGINEGAEVTVNGQSIAYLESYEENRVEIYVT